MSKKFKRLSILFVVSLLFVVSIVSCFAIEVSTASSAYDYGYFTYKYFDNLEDAISSTSGSYIHIESSATFDQIGFYRICFEFVSSSSPETVTCYFNGDPVQFSASIPSVVGYTVMENLESLIISDVQITGGGGSGIGVPQDNSLYAIIEVQAVDEFQILLGDIPDVTDTVLTTATDVADTIVSTPLLLLMVVGLPVVSFGAGLLVRLIRRT